MQPVLKSRQKSGTAFTQCRGLTNSIFNLFGFWIMLQCILLLHPSYLFTLSLAECTDVELTIVLANCYWEYSICFRVIRVLPLVKTNPSIFALWLPVWIHYRIALVMGTSLYYILLLLVTVLLVAEIFVLEGLEGSFRYNKRRSRCHTD